MMRVISRWQLGLLNDIGSGLVTIGKLQGYNNGQIRRALENQWAVIRTDPNNPNRRRLILTAVGREVRDNYRNAEALMRTNDALPLTSALAAIVGVGKVARKGIHKVAKVA